MALSVLSSVPLVADMMQLIHMLWNEMGSEIILLLFFCTGFALFRLSSVRRFLPAGRLERAGKAVKEGSGPPSTPSSCEAAGRRPGLVQRSTSAQKPQRQPPSPTATAAHELNVRAALAAEGAEAALAALAEMAAAGAAASAPLICAILDAAARSGEAVAASLLGRLPAQSLSADAAGLLLQRAATAADAALAREAGRCAVALPAVACEAALKACAAAGDGGAVEVFEAMLQGGFEPQESVLTALVSLCADSKHVALAEHVVAHTRRANGRVLLPIYAAMMKVYGQARLWHKACDLYDAMKKDGVVLDTVAYGVLIKAAVESGRTDLARELFRESGNPDLLNYMSMIRAAGRERDLPKALRLLEELEKSPLVPDATTYNCVLEACAVCNDREAADRLFQRMAKTEQIDVVSYNTYLKVLLSTGAHSQASGILRQMSSRGLPPNAVTYNSLIRDAVARTDLQRAWSIVEAMSRAGVRPDAFTCSILVKGMKSGNCAADVDRVLEMIEREGIVPDEVLLNCLLDACVRLRDPRRLSHVLEQVKAGGAVPSPHAYATLIRAYGYAHRCDRAWEMWQEVQKDGAAPQSEEVFGAMVEACLAGGDLRGGLAVFRDAREQLAASPRAATIFAACVKACVQGKHGQLAIDLYSETKDHFVCGKVTFNTLIDILVRQGDMVRAGALFRDMALKNVTPDLITYSTLIKGHCARGDLEQGLQLLGLMHRRGIKPDAVLFNSILDGCAHKQMRTLTEQVLRDMEAADIAPSNFTISILIKLYGRCGDLDAAFQVVETYPEKYGFQLNAQVFTCLMSACMANGAMGKAIEVYEGMASWGCAPDARTYQTLLGGCVRAGDVRNIARALEDVVRADCAARVDGDAIEAAVLLLARRGAPEAGPLLAELEARGARVSERVRRAAAGETPVAATPTPRREGSARFGSLGSSESIGRSSSGGFGSSESLGRSSSGAFGGQRRPSSGRWE